MSDRPFDLHECLAALILNIDAGGPTLNALADARKALARMQAPEIIDDEGERICFSAGLEQWRRSLKRPDLQEEDRVKGALHSALRQAMALRMIPAAKP